MMRLWGHTERSPLDFCATSRVATSPRTSNLPLTYMGQNLALGRMLSVLAASGAMALLCGVVDSSRIRLLGRCNALYEQTGVKFFGGA